jgi:hypothetical protein
MRAKAREHVVAQYDLKTVCLPSHLALIRQLTGRSTPPRRRRRGAAAAAQPVSVR